MTPLLSVLNVLFFLAHAGFILQFGRKRLLSERSSLICLGASSFVYIFFQSEVLWRLLLDYPGNTPLYHVLFVFIWAVTCAVTYGCLKLTEISRIKRKLVQDLALLNFEPASPAAAADAPDVLLTQDSKK